MPRADQLGFADSSRIGIQVSADQEFISMSLDYGSGARGEFLTSFLMPIYGATLIETLQKSTDHY